MFYILHASWKKYLFFQFYNICSKDHGLYPSPSSHLEHLGLFSSQWHYEMTFADDACASFIRIMLQDVCFLMRVCAIPHWNHKPPASYTPACKSNVKVTFFLVFADVQEKNKLSGRQSRSRLQFLQNTNLHFKQADEFWFPGWNENHNNDGGYSGYEGAQSPTRFHKNCMCRCCVLLKWKVCWLKSRF